MSQRQAVALLGAMVGRRSSLGMPPPCTGSQEALGALNFASVVSRPTPPRCACACSSAASLLSLTRHSALHTRKAGPVMIDWSMQRQGRWECDG